jgi:hypothetical protein
VWGWTGSEFDATTPGMLRRRDRVYQRNYRMVGYGYWRDVWITANNDNLERAVYKTMRYEHDQTLRNFDRMRRDALVMDRMTKSEYIIDIYSFCGTSSISEFGDGGDIPMAIFTDGPEISQIEKLRIGGCWFLLFLLGGCKCLRVSPSGVIHSSHFS